MNPGAFARYARCYDLLYRDKDYAGEARLVDGLLRGAGVNPPGPVLDVGCGTGMHARAMASLGWRMSGVDLSPDMIDLARERTATGVNIEYVAGAAADFKLGRNFLAIVSLFHVASYQAAPGELRRMLLNLSRHLVAGGVLIFDFWHGPGVRADPPTVRTRNVEDGEFRVDRLCTPRHLPGEQRVDVQYDLRVTHLARGSEESFGELHRLRYYFLPEIEAALREAGLRIELTRAGLTDAPLDETSWYGLVLARKGP